MHILNTKYLIIIWNKKILVCLLLWNCWNGSIAKLQLLLILILIVILTLILTLVITVIAIVPLLHLLHTLMLIIHLPKSNNYSRRSANPLLLSQVSNNTNCHNLNNLGNKKIYTILKQSYSNITLRISSLI